MENDQIKSFRFLVIGILLLCYSTDVYSHNLLQISLRSVLEQVMRSSQYGMDINDEPTGPFLRGILESERGVLDKIRFQLGDTLFVTYYNTYLNVWSRASKITIDNYFKNRETPAIHRIRCEKLERDSLPLNIQVLYEYWNPRFITFLQNKLNENIVYDHPPLSGIYRCIIISPVTMDISHVPVFSSESLTPEIFKECIDEWEDRTCDGEICRRK